MASQNIHQRLLSAPVDVERFEQFVRPLTTQSYERLIAYRIDTGKRADQTIVVYDENTVGEGLLRGRPI